MLGDATTIRIEWLAIFSLETATESTRRKTEETTQRRKSGFDGRGLSKRHAISGRRSRRPRVMLASITGLGCALFPCFTLDRLVELC